MNLCPNIAQQIKLETKNQLNSLPIKLGLAIVLVGDNPESKIFVKRKIAYCNEVGIEIKLIEVLDSENFSFEKIKNIILDLNRLNTVHGIILQLPLPSSLRKHEFELVSLIDPNKDVDCLHPENLGKLINGESLIVPLAAGACMEILRMVTGGPGDQATGEIRDARRETRDAGKLFLVGNKIALVGWGKIVGRPLAAMLLNAGATVTVCHEYTNNLTEETKRADIIITAVGKPGLITKEMVKKDAIVIDIGTTLVDGKIRGDVDFEEVSKVASFVTPVPGGVGPITVAMIGRNLLECYKIQNMSS